MENFEFKKNKLEDLLKELKINKGVLEENKDLLNKINFINIDINSKEGEIHLKMLAALFDRKDDKSDIVLTKIINNINIKELERIDIKSEGVIDLDIENIDMGIGKNRRVDRIDCYLKDGRRHSFSFSADLFDIEDDLDSNTWLEKDTFDSDFAKDNLILQEFYIYLKKEFNGKLKRFIAKEYLVGTNVADYLENHIKTKEDLYKFLDVSEEMARSMAYLYNKGNTNLLSDLKLENFIYNYIDGDNYEYSARLCDHSGFYDKKSRKNSIFELLAQISSIVNHYLVKINKFNISEKDYEYIYYQELIDAYLRNFLLNIDKNEIVKTKEELRKILNESQDTYLYDIKKDLINDIISLIDSYDIKE